MSMSRRPAAVLFERDGALIRDVPRIADPEQVNPVPGAADALSRLRRAGVMIAVLASEPGVSTGEVSADELHQVNARVEELLGPFDAWAICVHDVADSCSCRKPRPGLIIRAAAIMDISPLDCVIVGDEGGDSQAAKAAGARSILISQARRSATVRNVLVPDPRSGRPPAAPDQTATDLTEAVDQIMELEPVERLNQLVAGGALHPAQVAAWSRW